MRGRNDSRYEQFEISPETIEQEFANNDRHRPTGRFKENYKLSMPYRLFGPTRRNCYDTLGAGSTIFLYANQTSWRGSQSD